MNISHILVPVDFSDGTPHAIQYAVGLGVKFSSRITLFHVVQPIIPPEGMIMEYDAYHTEMSDDATVRLRELVNAATLDLEMDFDQTVGTPWVSVVDYAKRSMVDLIVMPTHGRGALKHLFLGSVAERVVRHAACPVLVVRQPNNDGKK